MGTALDKHHKFIFLDGVRGIAALAVLFYHASMYEGHTRFFGSATIAVDLFFCLSGFVIAWSYLEKLVAGQLSITAYITKRLIRLYPMFLIGILLGFTSLVILRLQGEIPNSYDQIIKASALNFLYLPYFSGKTIDWGYKTANVIFPLNPPSWSLLFEMVANLALIFTISFSRKLLVILTIGLGLCFIIVTRHIGIEPGWSTTNYIGGFPRVGYSFMLGVLIYKYFAKVKSLPNIHPLIIVLGLVGLFMMPKIHGYYVFWIMSVLILLPAVVAFGSKVQISNISAKKALEYLGWISYPIYCIHIPVIRIVQSIWSENYGFYHLEVLAVFITIILAHITAKLFDEPVRKWLTNQVNLVNRLTPNT